LPHDGFRPVKPQPAQIIDGLHVGAGLHARALKIIDAKDHPPAALPGEHPIDDERPRVAEVQRAGGRGRKSCCPIVNHSGKRRNPQIALKCWKSAYLCLITIMTRL
jgi:hypothetical protein